MRQHLEAWAARLALPNPAFAGLPACPFAATARWACYEAATDLITGLLAGAHMFAAGCWDTLIYLLPVEATPLDAVVEFAEFPDIVALLSDPAAPLVVAGYRTTQSQRRLYLFQSKRALTAARSKLSESGYYGNWDAADKARIGV